MLTSKQRAKLRALANPLDTLVQIGKGGVTPHVVAQLDQTLTAHELVKCRVLESAGLTAREASEALCAALGCEPVQCIGARLTVYRRNAEKPVIELG